MPSGPIVTKTIELIFSDSSLAPSSMSFEEIINAKPSLEYDGIYGYESGDWTTRMFLEAVYDDLR